MSSSPLTVLFRRSTATDASIESSALVVSAAVFVLTALSAIVAFWSAEVPISGPGSVGQFVSLASFLVGAAVFVLVGVWTRRASETAHDGSDGPARTPLRWFDIAALAFAHGSIALLGWLAAADLLDRSFSGATLYPAAACVLAAAGTAVTAYAVFLSAIHLGPMQLSLVLVVFLVCGVFASMLTATDPLWWQQNLSTLGMSDDVSARAFNITLVVAGVIVATIAHFAAAQLPASNARTVRSRRFVRIALSLIGILLAGVGLFPVDEFLAVHNTCATGMVVVYVVLVLRLRGLVPSVPRPFVLFGFVCIGIVVVLAVFFAVGYYTLTAVELVAFLLIFSWLIVFVRITGASREPRA